MQTPSSFLADHGILESEFDVESMLEQMASQAETAARAPFIAPAVFKEQKMQMDSRHQILSRLEVADEARFRLANSDQGLTGALPIFMMPASVSRARIEAASVIRCAPADNIPKERFKAAPPRVAPDLESLDYASLDDLLAEIQLKTVERRESERLLAIQEKLDRKLSVRLAKLFKAGAAKTTEAITAFSNRSIHLCQAVSMEVTKRSEA
ncbi:MAG: hypothetical protein IAF58_22365 [Leptolyngbya sp.]|nr:hypothetical protein [Candidatus Melainabacteria bacterium]